MSGDGERAYVAGLTLLARRELAEAQLRTRLARRKFDEDEIDAAVTRLRRERALDDRRTALACARTEVRLRHRGRARVVRQIEALGIARDVARDAVAEVFADIDETELLERALDRRLRRGLELNDAAAVRRVHRYLLGQGFDPDRVAALLRTRAKNKKSL
ncbi:MAG TPA: regulatory protein RecX [Vicinamibacterales bacterium]|jgi:regulatory protein